MFLLMVVFALLFVGCMVFLILEIRAYNDQNRQILRYEEENKNLLNRNLRLMELLAETSRKAEEMEKKNSRKLFETHLKIEVLEKEKEELLAKCKNYESQACVESNKKMWEISLREGKTLLVLDKKQTFCDKS